MGLGTIIILAIAICVAAYQINARFKRRYNQYAVAWGPLAFQTVFLLFVWGTRPISYSVSNKAKPSVWFFVWIALTILSYLIGIVMCWKKAEAVRAVKEDKYLAVVAQIIVPAVILLAVFVILIGLSGAGNKDTKSRKKGSSGGGTSKANNYMDDRISYNKGGLTIQRNLSNSGKELRNGTKRVAYYEPFRGTYTADGKFLGKDDMLEEIANNLNSK